MASSTFHAFPRLPCELRLRIWELALRPQHAGGLHHFFIDLEGNKDGIDPKLFVGVDDWAGGIDPAKRDIALNIGRLQSNSSATPGKGSVYYWDAGLWTACRESRDVITRRSESDYQHRTEHYSLLRRERIGCRHPSFAKVRQGNQAWNLVVQPQRDLFCFHVQGWGMDFLLPHPSVLQVLQSPVCGRWRLDRDEHTQPTSVQHFALEFDSSWNTDWPKGPDELLGEASPRGFVARLILRAVLAEVGFFIWLIDGDVPAPNKPLEHAHGQVFYDMDAEYVETPQWCVRESSYFIDHINQSLGDWYQFLGEEIPHVGDSFDLNWSFDTEAYIGILARREKS
ncbi:hypothetical protein MAC_04182 [Metarhizium acridum CQMa 102]|uniref:2EXR domain-containing protein n=2 Tax=Metarhizium acridum TaxID=92637 RepID=E9E2T4_METAQ|nr:uncharacterized protein MAC_04182 [Metarhizium acridum CQMa 102]EFY89750.1 hypothetical protein MAC_04182 [Metarhizium acridum CQMa 102]